MRRAANAVIDAGIHPVIVVLGSDADLIEPALAGLPSVTTVVNAEWATGLASSIAVGIRAIFDIAPFDAVLVTLADQPLVDADALQRLVAGFDAGHRIVASEYNGTVGVPALFGGEHADSLLQLDGDVGAGPWLRARGSEVTRIPLPIAELDIDMPSDVARLSGRDRDSIHES